MAKQYWQKRFTNVVRGSGGLQLRLIGLYRIALLYEQQHYPLDELVLLWGKGLALDVEKV